MSVKNYKSAREVLLMYDEEGVVPTVETLQYLADQLKSNGEVVDFVVPSVKPSEPKVFHFSNAFSFMLVISM